MLLRSLEDGVQPPVIRNPGEGAFHHPADSGRNEDTIMAAGDCFDGDTERLAGTGQPFAPVAEVAQCRSMKPRRSYFQENPDADDRFAA